MKMFLCKAFCSNCLVRFFDRNMKKKLYFENIGKQGLIICQNEVHKSPSAEEETKKSAEKIHEENFQTGEKRFFFCLFKFSLQ